jgi:hypothetical protein
LLRREVADAEAAALNQPDLRVDAFEAGMTLSLAATEYKIATYGGSTGPDVAGPDPHPATTSS